MKLSLILSLFCGACTWSEGQPWGTADVSLQVAPLLPSEGRLTPEGWLKTSKNYGVDIQALSMRAVSLALQSVAAGTSLSFDPAKPPPGYTLCHNGHCHADDGRLVDYADIELELRGAASPGGASLTLAIDSDVDLVAGVRANLVNCSDGCDLEPGTLSAMVFDVSAIAVDVVVYDLSSANRLPSEGLHALAVWSNTTSVLYPLEVEIGRGRRVGVEIAGVYTLPSAVFDDIDWEAYVGSEPADLSNAAEARNAVVSRLSQTENLAVNVRRFEP